MQITFTRPVAYSLEDINSSEGIERELEVYVLAMDLRDLMRAQSVERQEQYGIVPKRDEYRGTTRVRKSTIRGESTYTHTTKFKQPDGSSIETNADSTEEMLQAFKRLATDGLVKDRYVFPIEGTELIWEVDAFPKLDGPEPYQPWLKLDLEIPEGTVLSALPALPIRAKEVLLKDPNNPEANKRIDALYEQYFRTPV